MDIAHALRQATQPLHQRLEDLPYARALAAGTISRAAYVRGLYQLVYVHEALESELDRHDVLTCVWQPAAMARRAALSRDLAQLGGSRPEPALRATQALTELFRTWSVTLPWRLLGPLYVLEGSRMGSMFLVPAVARALGVPPLPGHGLDYHLDGLGDRPQAWQRAKAALAAAVPTEERATEVVQAAVATFAGLYDLYAALSEPAGACARAEAEVAV